MIRDLRRRRDDKLSREEGGGEIEREEGKRKQGREKRRDEMRREMR